MDARRSDSEEALEVGFRGRFAVEQDISVNESEVLALLISESSCVLARHGDGELIQARG